MRASDSDSDAADPRSPGGAPLGAVALPERWTGAELGPLSAASGYSSSEPDEQQAASRKIDRLQRQLKGLKQGGRRRRQRSAAAADGEDERRLKPSAAPGVADDALEGADADDEEGSDFEESSADDEDEPQDALYCARCSMSLHFSDEADAPLCDALVDGEVCPNLYHLRCLAPEEEKRDEDGFWFCPQCRRPPVLQLSRPGLPPLTIPMMAAAPSSGAAPTGPAFNPPSAYLEALEAGGGPGPGPGPGSAGAPLHSATPRGRGARLSARSSGAGTTTTTTMSAISEPAPSPLVPPDGATVRPASLPALPALQPSLDRRRPHRLRRLLVALFCSDGQVTAVVCGGVVLMGAILIVGTLILS